MTLEQQIREQLPNFELKKLYKVNKLTIDNTEDLSLHFEFEYTDYTSSDKTKYHIGCSFTHVRFVDCQELNLLDILDLNNFSIEDISALQWEQVYWRIQDADDDGLISFAFNCRSIVLDCIAKK